MLPERRRPTLRSGSCAWIAAAVAVLLTGCAAPDRPNLLLVSMDTTRADHLGAYGYRPAQTPTIDALAARGFLFRNHLTPVPITLPAHSSLMTGLTPPQHSVRDNGTFVLPAAAVTLAEVLHDAGYDTAGFVGSFPLDSRFGIDQGFAHYDDTLPPAERPDIYFDERPAGLVVASALRYLRGRERRRPFFVFVHVFDPHQPQLPPPPFDVALRDRPYDGEIAYVDSQLRVLFDDLATRGELERTVVALTADHGEGLGDHGEATHSLLLHQATLHIPLILAGPGVPIGTTGAWTQATEVAATLLELLGLDPGRLDPRAAPSLRPLLVENGQPVPPRPRFRAYFETIAPRTSLGWAQLTAWMEGDWRYVHAPRPQLFDLATDPGELADRAPDAPDQLAAFARDLAAYLDANEVATVGQAAQTTDRQTLERLAALGYLQLDAGSLAGIHDLLDQTDLVDPKDRIGDLAVFSNAKSAMVTGRLSAAEALWQALLARSPDNPHAWRGLAHIYFEIGQPERALATIDAALATHAPADPLRRLRGELLIQLGRPAEGLAELERLARDTTEAETWIGKALAALGRATEAQAAYRRGLAVDPASRWLRLYLANSLAANNEQAAAEAIYRDLTRDEPYFALGFYNHALSLSHQGRHEEAVTAARRALALAPNHAPTRQLVAQLAATGGEVAPPPTADR